MRIVSLGALASILLAAASARAADPTSVEATADEHGGGGAVDASVTLGVPNLYYAGSVIHGAEGILAQPGVEAGVSAGDVRVFVGFWGSIQNGPAGGAATTLHEADYTAGATLELGGGVSAVLKYVACTSPADAFEARHEVTLAFEMDDEALWQKGLGGRFKGFKPAIAATVDVAATDFRTGAGLGGELAVAPTFAVVPAGTVPVSVSVPMILDITALGAEGDTLAAPVFDSFRAGARVELGLGFVPEGAGEWTAALNAGVLGVSDAVAEANDGQHVVFLGSVEVGASF
ncbi:MAG: hypothetical protein KC635_26445 [Myxococcales bacterium]|nr:hypothetical protein [Myxococcales bacterium]